MPADTPGCGTWWVLVPTRLMYDGSVSLSPHSMSALALPCPYELGSPGKRPQGAQEPAGRRELENVPRVWQQQQAERAAGSHAQLPGYAQLLGVRLCHTMSQDAQPGWAHPCHAKLCPAQAVPSLAMPSWVHARLGCAAPNVLCQCKPCPGGSRLANLAHVVPKAALCQAMPWNTELSSATPCWTMPSWAMLCQAELCPKFSMAMPGLDKPDPTSSHAMLCQVKPSHCMAGQHSLAVLSPAWHQGCHAGLSHAKPYTQPCCAVLPI